MSIGIEEIMCGTNQPQLKQHMRVMFMSHLCHVHIQCASHVWYFCWKLHMHVKFLIVRTCTQFLRTQLHAYTLMYMLIAYSYGTT